MRSITFILAFLFLLLLSWAISQPISLTESFAEILKDPWGIILIIDVYAGLLLVAVFFFFIEENKWIALVWGLLLLSIGNGISFLFIGVYWKKIAEKFLKKA